MRGLNIKYLASLVAIILIIAALYVRLQDNIQSRQDQLSAGGANDKGLERDSSFYQNSSEIKKSEPKNDDGISAKAYVVGDVSTGKIYLQRSSSLKLPVASMSKLVTALAATDSMSSSSTVIVPKLDIPGDSSKLVAGESFTLEEALYPMLLNSSNIAAEAIASSSGRKNFIEAMYAYAHEVGMPSTYFADPSGLNSLNASSANDFFALAQYLYKYRPDILEITRIASTSVATTSDHGSHIFTNIHPFVGSRDFIGGKTGRTPEAKDTMLTIMNINSQPIAIVVLASEDRKADTTALITKIRAILK